ncbi:hypothetical protein [Rickettsiales endosymbiont of Peranema trichophorum]|nr:hypothetical protein [Rickettsiales endosymbiont of Peranema trichophorum]
MAKGRCRNDKGEMTESGRGGECGSDKGRVAWSDRAYTLTYLIFADKL